MSRSTSPVSRVLNSPRAHVDHVVRAHEGQVETIARIVWALPRDGAGRLRVVVYDWGADGDGYTEPQIGAASGCGYDKSTAALCGLTIGGVELGDHCDHLNRPTLSALCAARGWRILSGTP